MLSAKKECVIFVVLKLPPEPFASCRNNLHMGRDILGYPHPFLPSSMLLTIPTAGLTFPCMRSSRQSLVSFSLQPEVHHEEIMYLIRVTDLFGVGSKL